MLFVLYALFFLSGAAGLIYESIWTRYLALLVGHSAYAQILVLTIFLGGMAVGSFLVGRYSERLHSPLIWYAIVEAAVGLLGLLFHPTFRAVSAAAYDSIFPALIASPGAQSAVKWLLAASLILPQSILLGATFPLISAGILRRWKFRPGAVLSWLYASNSFGAAVGVLLAGFYLVSRFDFPGTLAFAAALNFAAAAVTLVVARRRARCRHPSPIHRVILMDFDADRRLPKNFGGIRGVHNRALRDLSRRHATGNVLRGHDAAADHAHSLPRRQGSRDR